VDRIVAANDEGGLVTRTSLKASAPTKPTSLRERNKQMTRDAILGAVMLLIERDGVASTSMGEVAELAGVSDTTVFNYFKTKEELVDALVEELVGPRSLIALLDRRPPSEPPLRALRNVLKDAGRAAAAGELATKKRQHLLAQSDKPLWGAYLRSNYGLAAQLAEAFERRAPSWSTKTATAAAFATVGALEAVFASQRVDGDIEAWAADIDEVLSRLERAWRR
jgi:AcrR family transcriptional regulator